MIKHIETKAVLQLLCLQTEGIELYIDIRGVKE